MNWIKNKKILEKKKKNLYSYITQKYCLLFTDCEQTIIFSSYFLVFLNFQIRNSTDKDEIVLFSFKYSSVFKFIQVNNKLYFSVNKNNCISPPFVQFFNHNREVFEIIIARRRRQISLVKIFKP